MAEDVVEVFLRRLLEVAPGTPPTVAAELERRLRADVGGGRYYVRQSVGAYRKAYGLGTGIAAGLSLTEAADAMGVPLPTAYRLTRRRFGLP